MDANAGYARTGTIDIVFAGGTVSRVIQQAAYVNSSCTYTLSPTVRNAAYNDSAVWISVTTQIGCLGSVASNAVWAVPVAGTTNGSGAGVIQLSTNAGNSSRTATITIGGQTATVVQGFYPCPASLPVTSS